MDPREREKGGSNGSVNRIFSLFNGNLMNYSDTRTALALLYEMDDFTKDSFHPFLDFVAFCFFLLRHITPSNARSFHTLEDFVVLVFFAI